MFPFEIFRFDILWILQSNSQPKLWPIILYVQFLNLFLPLFPSSLSLVVSYTILLIKKHISFLFFFFCTFYITFFISSSSTVFFSTFLCSLSIIFHTRNKAAIVLIFLFFYICVRTVCPVLFFFTFSAWKGDFLSSLSGCTSVFSWMAVFFYHILSKYLPTYIWSIPSGGRGVEGWCARGE